MKANQLNLFGEELIIDNFAGGGGASTGIEQALARAVDIAINHDADALAMHKANHPETHHLCDDVFKVDPRKVCNGYRVGAAWFSPDCKDFSKAKGGKPVSKKIRGLAWVMVKWAAIKRPRVLFLENVEEFKEWGPLRKDGKRCPERKGKTFRNFCARLRNLGYEVDHRELRACDYGAPTSRKRLFLIARCDGSPIVWPPPTHGKPGTPDVESGKIKPWRTAAECIDFSLPCPSIFLTKRGAKKLKLNVIRPLAPATMRRIARGIFKFVIENPKPFIVKVNHTGYEQFRGQSIDEPLQTITSKHPYAVVSPHITKFRTGATGSKVDDPLPTITAGPKENPAGAAHAMGMVAATLVPRYGEREGQAPRAIDVEKPMPTIVPTQNGASLVEAQLEPMWEHGRFHCKCGTNFGVNDYDSNTVTCPKCGNIDINTIQDFLQDGGAIEVAPFMTEHANASEQRVFSVEEPMRTQCAEVKGGHFAQVSAFLAKHYGGNETPGSNIDKPVDTITEKDHHALVAVHMATNRHENVGGAAGEPMKTQTTGKQQALVTSNLIKMRGTNIGQKTDAPLPTISAGGTHHAEVRAFLTKYYTTGTTKSFAQDLNQPMHTIKGKACFGLVTVHGEDYVIVDIGMRMLEPRELFLAQGFPPDYVIAEVNGKKLAKNAQVRMCGNSVPPPLSKALVKANVPELIRRKTERAA